MNNIIFPNFVSSLANLEHARSNKSLWRHTVDEKGAVVTKKGISLIAAYVGHIWHWITGTTKKVELETCKHLFNEVIEKMNTNNSDNSEPMPLSGKTIRQITRRDIKDAKHIFETCNYLQPDFHPQAVYDKWCQDSLTKIDGIRPWIWRGIVWEKEVAPETGWKECLRETKEILSPLILMPHAVEKKLNLALQNPKLLSEYRSQLGLNPSPIEIMFLMQTTIQKLDDKLNPPELKKLFNPIKKALWKEAQQSFNKEDRRIWSQTGEFLGKHFPLDIDRKLALYEYLKNNEIREQYKTALATSLETQKVIIWRLKNGEAIRLEDADLTDFKKEITNLDNVIAAASPSDILQNVTVNPIREIAWHKCAICNTQLFTDSLFIGEDITASAKSRGTRYLDNQKKFAETINSYPVDEQTLIASGSIFYEDLGIWKKSEWLKEYQLDNHTHEPTDEIRSRTLKFTFDIPGKDCITVTQALYETEAGRGRFTDKQILSCLAAVVDAEDQDEAFEQALADLKLENPDLKLELEDEMKLSTIIYTFTINLENKISAAYVQIGKPSIKFPYLTTRTAPYSPPKIVLEVRELLSAFDELSIDEDSRRVLSAFISDTPEHQKQFQQFVGLCKKARTEHLDLLSKNQPIPPETPINFAIGTALDEYIQRIKEEVPDENHQEIIKRFLSNLVERATITNDQVNTDDFTLGLPESIDSLSITRTSWQEENPYDEDGYYSLPRDGSGIFQKSIWEDVNGSENQPFISGFRVIGMKSALGITRERKVFLDIQDLGTLNAEQCKGIFSFLREFDDKYMKYTKALAESKPTFQLGEIGDLLDAHVPFLEENRRKILVSIAQDFWDRMHVATEKTLLNLGHPD
jgi:hypothetical protein